MVVSQRIDMRMDLVTGEKPCENHSQNNAKTMQKQFKNNLKTI